MERGGREREGHEEGMMVEQQRGQACTRQMCAGDQPPAAAVKPVLLKKDHDQQTSCLARIHLPTSHVSLLRTMSLWS